MGCAASSTGMEPMPSSLNSTLLEGSTGDDAMCLKTLATSRGSLLTNVDGMSGRKAIDGFIPILGHGVLIGTGSDARSVTLHSASLGGLWINSLSQDVVVTEKTCSNIPSNSSKRWLVAAYDDGYLKVVELDVNCHNDQLYVQAVSASHQQQRGRVSACNVHVGREANMALDSDEKSQSKTMTAAPVATSSTALGFGVHFLAFSQQHDRDDSNTNDSTQTGGSVPDAHAAANQQVSSRETTECLDTVIDLDTLQRPVDLDMSTVVQDERTDFHTVVVVMTPVEETSRFACC